MHFIVKQLKTKMCNLFVNFYIVDYGEGWIELNKSNLNCIMFVPLMLRLDVMDNIKLNFWQFSLAKTKLTFQQDFDQQDFFLKMSKCVPP